jgi:lipoate---protein ligase
MILKTRIIRTNTLNPWWNLAVEEYLLDRAEKDECILYLWQNQNTVVIGKTQNPWRECRTELLEKEEGKLARRLSGGGAVFHDTGNLNFTFIMNKEDYNLKRQVNVILEAVKKKGISAQMTGRNDITVEERKFSGNAFCFRKTNAYHHGTILISADLKKLGRYLEVSQEKMQSKGIQSVQSRVTNLSEYQPSLSVDAMAAAMETAFLEQYGGEGTKFGTEEMDQIILQKLYEKYASWEWRYGEAPKFDINLDTRFPWGGIEIGLRLEKGRIVHAKVYSDAIDEEFISVLPEHLMGVAFSSSELSEAIRKLSFGQERKQMTDDIAQWLEMKQF